MTCVGRSVRVTGRVQGVFFRAWTREQAQALGVSGWIRNCPDGSVAIHVSGEEAAFDQLLERVRQGPPSARVDEVQVSPAAPDESDRFEVRH